jgi:hypothetical protein
MGLARAARGSRNIRAAVRLTPHRRFRGSQILDVADFGTVDGRIAAGIAAAGVATVAWGGREGREARVSSAGVDGRFAGITRLGRGFQPDVAVREDGATLVTFRTPGGPELPGPWQPMPAQRIAAYLRPPQATQFLPLEFVSGLEGPTATLYSDTEPRAAFAPPQGRATVLWPAAALDGQPARRLAGTAVLKLATRAP